jgi:ABC-type polysaccharide/polyol phosphate transport system ATPase subunit
MRNSEVESVLKISGSSWLKRWLCQRWGNQPTDPAYATRAARVKYSGSVRSALAVEFSRVSKSYPIYASPGHRLKELATFQRRRYHKDYWALQDVSFEVQRGETFCIIGENGCGKSTLLQICAGILQPSSGTIDVWGRVAALLELGAGFNPEFTGRDNVYLNAAILGFSAKEMDRKFPDIAEFAEIGDFIEQPVKTYSSGMVVRLAFAVAINVDPEILLVDEALAVGDVYFRQRCLRKVHELRSRGVTILLVSHANAEIKALGDRALWLDHGKLMALGKTDRVVSQYMAAMAEKDANYQATDILHHHPAVTAPPEEIVEGIPNIDHRYGDGRAEVIGIAVCDADGNRLKMISPDSQIVVRVSVRAKEDLNRPIVGVTFRDQRGLDLAGSNTDSEGCTLQSLLAGEVCTVDFHLDIPTLYTHTISFSPAIANGTLEHFGFCDWVDNAVVLEMTPPDGPMYGALRFRCRVEVNTRVSPRAPAGTVAR